LAFAQDGSGGGYTFTGKCCKCGKEGHRAYQCTEKGNGNNNSKTTESKTETAAATTDKVVSEDLNHTDGTTHYETYEDDIELLFCQQGGTSVNVGVFDYDKACNQVLTGFRLWRQYWGYIFLGGIFPSKWDVLPPF
jgi:hypothetical protein